MSALFAYGSLLDRRLRERLLGRPIRCIPGRLPGYDRRRGRYFYIVRHRARQTKGLLLLDLSRGDYALLDRYEEVPRLYRRRRRTVIDALGNRVSCWVYVPTPLACRDAD